MHVSLRIGATTLLASDGPCLGHPDFQGFSLCLTAADPAEAGRLFAALADGGKVDQPLVRTFSPKASAWSPTGSGCPGC